LAALAIDLLSAIVGGDLCQLRQRNALARGRKQAHVLDGLARISILLLIAQRHVESSLALLHLGQALAPTVVCTASWMSATLMPQRAAAARSTV